MPTRWDEDAMRSRHGPATPRGAKRVRHSVHSQQQRPRLPLCGLLLMLLLRLSTLTHPARAASPAATLPAGNLIFVTITGCLATGVMECDVPLPPVTTLRAEDLPIEIPRGLRVRVHPSLSANINPNAVARIRVENVIIHNPHAPLHIFAVSDSATLRLEHLRVLFPHAIPQHRQELPPHLLWTNAGAVTYHDVVIVAADGLRQRELATGKSAPIAQLLTLHESTCAIQAPPTSDLRCWGQNQYGQLGQGDITNRGVSPQQMGANLSAVDLGTGLTPRPNVTTTTLGQHCCLVLDPPGSVKCFGRGNLGELGYEDSAHRGDDPGELGDALPFVDLGSSLPPILQLAQGSVHNCVLFAVHFRVKCWGYNFRGQLGYEDTSIRGHGTGDMGDSLPFVDIGTGLGAVGLIVGGQHTCARLNDTRQGGLKCWGYNMFGQLGYGDTNDRGVGVGEMGDALPMVNVSSSGHLHVIQGDGGAYHTCVLLNDSAVKCFGTGSTGLLGYGDTANRGVNPGEMGDSLPAVDVLGSVTGVEVVSVQCGEFHSCALISDGSLKCWGYGAFGQLGQENTSNIGDNTGEMGDALPAIQLGALGVMSAVLGQHYTCVRLNDSSVKCFGDNSHGQLGQGDTNKRGDNAGEMGSSLPVVDIGPVITPVSTPAPSTALTPVPSAPPTPPLTSHPALPLLAPVAQVIALYESTCSIQAPPASDLRCWGRNDHGQLGQGDMDDRGGAQWDMGANLSAVDLGTGLTPRPNATTTSIHHSCYLLDPDGSVKCFGRGDVGQLGYGDTALRGSDPGELGDALPVVDLGSSLPPILQLVQGGFHSCVLFAQNNRIKCWGSSVQGLLGYEDMNNRGDGAGEMGDSLPFVDLGTGLGAHKLFVGYFHTCARLNDTRQGGLKCWGYNLYGQLGYGDSTDRGDGVGEMGDALAFVSLASSGHVHVTQGDGGSYHTCVLLNDSAVKCFGYGRYGRLGYGDTADRGDEPGEMGDSLPAVDVLGSVTGVHVTRVQCGGSYSCALISDGSMKCWGYGLFGQLGQENTTDIGDNAGEMGDSLLMIQLGDHAVVSASLGAYHTCVRLNDSSVKCFGLNNYGQLGQGDTDNRGTNIGEMGSALPVVDIGPVITSAPTLAPTAAPTPALTAAPSTAPTSGPTPVPTTAPTRAPTPGATFPLLAPVAQVIALYRSTCSIQLPPTSDLRCWGRNNLGQLGQGDTTNRGDSQWDMGMNMSSVDLGTGLTPRPNVSTTSLARHSCYVLDPTGSVKCFGWSIHGQLGYGDTDSRGSSVGELGDALPAVNLGSALPPILQLALGGFHSCVLFALDFRIKCWGGNLFGQLGYEDTNDRGDDGDEMGDSLPFVNLGTDLGAVELFTGFYHTCARLNDTRQGGLKCWGENAFGQLGYGDNSSRGDEAGEVGDVLPRVNLSSSGNIHVAHGGGGDDHTCVLLNDSVVKCFGRASQAQLGYEDAVHRGDDPGEMGDALPAVDVLGSATGVQVVRVQCGAFHSCALVSDGSLKCWGDGLYGQLGQENTNDIGDSPGEMGDALPVIRLGGQTVVSTSLGRWHTCVRLNDSSVKCFGRNDYGQLGLGDLDDRGDHFGEMGRSLPVVDVGPFVTASPALAPTPLPSPIPNASPQPSPAPTPTPTAAPTMAPTQSIATILAANEVPHLVATVQGGDTVHVRWPAQSDPRMTVVGYRVAMQTAKAGSFVTVSEPRHNWTTVTGLSPATEFRFKVAVVATRGVGLLSDHTAQVTTWSDTVGVFEDTGVAVRVISSIPLPGCDASAILDASEDVTALFGQSKPACTRINQRTARLVLVNGAALTPGTVVRAWTNETFAFSPPSNPTPIAPLLSSASHVSWCGSWTADAASSTGVGGSVYPLSYSWWVSSIDAGNAAAVAAENVRLSLFSSTTSHVLFNATRFLRNSIVTVHVSVVSSVFSLSASTHADTNVSALKQPTVSIVGSVNRSVLSYHDLAISTAVFTPECFSGSANSSVFSWVAVQGVMPVAATTATRTLFIPALSLDVTQTYIFGVRMTLDDFPMLPAVTADVQVSTLLTPPVVALAGGTQRTVVCESNTILDASQSYDPNVCSILEPCAAVVFTWSCIGCATFDVATDEPIVEFQACDLLNDTFANSTTLLLDVVVFSTSSGMFSSDTVQLTVLPPEVEAPPVLESEPIPQRVNPGSDLFVCTSTAVNLSVLPAANVSAPALFRGSGSYFIVPTSAMMLDTLYAVMLRAAGSPVTSLTILVSLNSPPALGSFSLSPDTGGEAVLDPFSLLSSGHVDEPADMPLSVTFWWTDHDTDFDALLISHAAEFSLTDVSLPVGVNVVCSLSVFDRLGADATRQASLLPGSSVTINDSPSWPEEVSLASPSTLWSRPGALAGTLRSWRADESEFAIWTTELLESQLAYLESAGAAFATGSASALAQFEVLYLMADVRLRNVKLVSVLDFESRLLSLSRAAFLGIDRDALRPDTCSQAVFIANLTDTADAAQTLLFLTDVADSACGEGVFEEDTTATTAASLYVNVSAGCSVFVSSYRTDVNDSIQVDELASSSSASACMAGFAVDVNAAAVAQVAAAPADSVEFVDMRLATQDASALDSDNAFLLSDVHSIELRPSSLPCTLQCNTWEGASIATCSPLDLPANTSDLPPSAVEVTISMDTLDDCGDIRDDLDCFHVQPEDIETAVVGESALKWSSAGCSLTDATPTEVTCSCNHLTAFAVGSLISSGGNDKCGSDKTECEKLEDSWSAFYDHPGYAAWLSALCAGWVFVLVTDAKWFYDPDTARQRSKFTLLVFTTGGVVVLAVLRTLYYLGMLVAFATVGEDGSMACAEFGLEGSGSVVPRHVLFVVHDVFYPVLLTVFSAMFLYWIILADLMNTNMGKAKNLLFLRPETQHKLMAFNVLLILYTVVVDVYLVVQDDKGSGSDAVARGHLAFSAAVYLLEGVLFIHGRHQLDSCTEDKSLLHKIDYMAKVICGLFVAMAVVLLVLAAAPVTDHPMAALVLYSVALPVLELAVVRFVYSTLHGDLEAQKGKDTSFVGRVLACCGCGSRVSSTDEVRLHKPDLAQPAPAPQSASAAREPPTGGTGSSAPARARAEAQLLATPQDAVGRQAGAAQRIVFHTARSGAIAGVAGTDEVGGTIEMLPMVGSATSAGNAALGALALCKESGGMLLGGMANAGVLEMQARERLGSIPLTQSPPTSGGGRPPPPPAAAPQPDSPGLVRVGSRARSVSSDSPGRHSSTESGVGLLRSVQQQQLSYSIAAPDSRDGSGGDGSMV